MKSEITIPAFVVGLFIALAMFRGSEGQEVEAVESAMVGSSDNGTWIGVRRDADGSVEQLAAGQYLFIHIPSSGDVSVTMIDTSGDGAPPAPPPSDIGERIDALLGRVGDPDKAKTASEIAGLIEIVEGMVEGGTIESAGGVADSFSGLVGGVLAVRGKSKEWKPFTDGFGDLLGRSKSISESEQMLQVAKVKLTEVQR